MSIFCWFQDLISSLKFRTSQLILRNLPKSNSTCSIGRSFSLLTRVKHRVLSIFFTYFENTYECWILIGALVFVCCGDWIIYLLGWIFLVIFSAYSNDHYSSINQSIHFFLKFSCVIMTFCWFLTIWLKDTQNNWDWSVAAALIKKGPRELSL